MVIGLIGPIARGIRIGLRYRKQLYRIITAQDRYIDKAMRAGGYGKSARYGVRHGALVGSLVGTLIAPDTPGNDDAIQKKPRKPITPRPAYQTRNRQTSRSGSQRGKQYKPSYCNRYPYTRRFR